MKTRHKRTFSLSIYEPEYGVKNSGFQVRHHIQTDPGA
jgi:hypothetical protein